MRFIEGESCTYYSAKNTPKKTLVFAQNLENKGLEIFPPPRSMVLKVVRGKILETLELWRFLSIRDPFRYCAGKLAFRPKYIYCQRVACYRPPNPPSDRPIKKNLDTPQNIENKGPEISPTPRSMVLKVVRGKILESLELISGFECPSSLRGSTGLRKIVSCQRSFVLRPRLSCG
jgi:hypothetical protein